MNLELKGKFLELWKKYFAEEELPITFYYSDDYKATELAVRPKGRSCLICELAKVRNGKSLAYSGDSVACQGARKNLGFSDTMRPGFEYFLSCGHEKMEGERYLQSPELVMEFLKMQPRLPVDGKYIVFKRWDDLDESDHPDVVIFFARPDVLSGLFTLANFDRMEPDSTITPFGAGCGSIVYSPFMESKTDRQRAVIGMFDPSARPCVQMDILSFAIPMKRFEKIINFMEESFLITETWSNVRKRIAGDK